MNEPNTLIIIATFALLLIAVYGTLAFRKHLQLVKRLPERTLGELRIGDSFVFDRKAKEIWRVMRKDIGVVYVNQKMRTDMHPKHEEDESHWMDTLVFFIRHTIPLPGEKIYVEDLAPGDVIALPLITDHWEITEKGYDFDTIKSINSGQQGKIGRMTEVLFVRHKQD